MKNSELDSPVDAVITWVDGEDKKHKEKIYHYAPKTKQKQKDFSSRYAQTNEILYCVHSILKHAGFVRNIFIVTDNQIPKFLIDEKSNKYKKIKVVDHTEIFDDNKSLLPVFNSRSIETKIHHIPGLAEHFIYFNDDMILLRPVSKSDFFLDNLPVLRGKWKPFKENILYKKLHFKKKVNQAGHVYAQEKSAKILGFQKLFKFHHTPHPMRISTIKLFFSNHNELEELNSSFKFRSPEQFLIQGIANHLEIKNGNCHVLNNYQMVHFRSYNKPIFWLKFKLNYFCNKKDRLFLNIQDLDLCPSSKQTYLIAWLNKRYQL
ncbi:MAG: Stealth CR1 domain-containing protein [Flavobacteriaceae bacterium]|nr:Stealth CR1 domain-containing protein [Flavobacteriaceae bacterium]